MTLVDPMRPIRSVRPQPPRRRLQAERPPANIAERRQTLKPQRRFRLPKRYAAAAVLIILLIVSPESIGQILVILYGVLTIVRRFSMTQTFAVAALLVLLSPIFTWLTGREENGVVLAGYSFILLGVGLVQMILAYRRASHGR